MSGSYTLRKFILILLSPTATHSAFIFNPPYALYAFGFILIIFMVLKFFFVHLCTSCVHYPRKVWFWFSPISSNTKLTTSILVLSISIRPQPPFIFSNILTAAFCRDMENISFYKSRHFFFIYLSSIFLRYLPWSAFNIFLVVILNDLTACLSHSL